MERLTEQAERLLKNYYLREGETPEQGFKRASYCYCGGDFELAERIYNYAIKGWFVFASPVLSNAVLAGEDVKALPISCFLNYVGDTLQDLIEHQSETCWLSVKGGGVGGHWSNVRAVSQKSYGVIPFLKVIDGIVTAYHQASTRRGSYACYLDVSHPDIMEFLSIRIPTGGDVNRKCLNLHNAVNITDEFLIALENDDDWNLVCPHSGTITETMKARKLWEHIIKTRFRTGEPYITYIDEANRRLPSDMQQAGLKIHGSNLCNEIYLPTSEERTAVCCLSSLNLELYEEWEDTSIVEDLVEFLDNVIEFFIQNAPKELRKAKYSAMRERSIGLGAMGFHYFLQRKGIPFESMEAKDYSYMIFRDIKEKAVEKTRKLAISKGSCPDVHGVRNAHLLAIAPNSNSSILVNTSPSIEPIAANIFEHQSRIGSYTIKNKYLKALLTRVGKDTPEVWKDILNNDGSVQGLDCLSPHEQEVFKNADEINQFEVINHARIRQEFICQGQSVNLFFKSGENPKYVNQVHLHAFTKDAVGVPLKGLYYLRTENRHKVEKLSQEVKREKLSDFECIGCQG